MNEYDVRVTRQVLEQMKEIVHYISNDLMAPDAAEYERGCRLCVISVMGKLSVTVRRKF